MQPNILTNITNTCSNWPPKCDQIFTDCPTWTIQDFDLDMFFLIKKWEKTHQTRNLEWESSLTQA